MSPQIAAPPSEKSVDFSLAYALPSLIIDWLNLTTKTMAVIKLMTYEQAYGMIAIFF